jgi:S-adenosylmethionine hydrolase
MMMPGTWISFLSDYGVTDASVGVCHGVIARHAPDVRIIDISHSVSPQDVEHGAVMLAGAVGYLPTGIRLVLVETLDAAGYTRGVAVRTGDGSIFVAPDNGVTSLSWDLVGGVVEAREISNPDLFLPLPTAVFRGRDVYAPVAGHLATNLPLAEVGPAVAQESLVRLTPRACRVDADHVHAEVVYVDHFGNAALNVDRTDLEAAGILFGDVVEVRTDGRRAHMPFTHSYAQVSLGEPVLCEDSVRRAMIAVNGGRASDVLRLRRRDALVIGQGPRKQRDAVRTVVGDSAVPLGEMSIL